MRLLGYTLEEVYDSLGVAHYHVVPDYYEFSREDGMVDRSLGIWYVPIMPFKVELRDVERVVKRKGDETWVEYHTPVDSVSCRLVYTEEMRRSGTRSAGLPTMPSRKFEISKLLRIGFICRQYFNIPIKYGQCSISQI